MSPSLAVDLALLKRSYLLKSREYHPDYFTTASEQEKQHALIMTSQINDAYQKLQDSESRLAYLLKLHGADLSSNAQALPQDFLMEMMELNEDIEAAQDEESKQAARKQVADLESTNWDQISDLVSLDDLSHLSDEDISRLTIAYLKNRYVLRLKEGLGDREAHE